MPQPIKSLNFGIILAVIASISFGIYPAAIRFAYRDGGNAIFMIVLTTWMRALGLYLYCQFAGKSIFQTHTDFKQGVIGGLFQAISILGILGALVFIPGPIVIIIVFTHTLMLLFFMAWKKEIKLNFSTLTTTVIALFGLSLVLDIWKRQPGSYLIGVALAFLAALATVSRLYVYGHQTRERNPAVVGAENFLAAAVFILLSIPFQFPVLPATLVGLIWAIIAGISLTVGTFGMFYGISLIGSFHWSLFCKMEPIFTALFSVLILGETLKFHQYFGMLIVLSSLVCYQLMNRKVS